MKDIYIRSSITIFLKYLSLFILWSIIPFLILILCIGRFDIGFWGGYIMSLMSIFIVCILAKKWTILSTKKRIILSILSPFNLVSLAFLMFWGYFYYKSDIEPRFKFTEGSDIEKQIGFEFPYSRELNRKLTLSNKGLISYEYDILITIELENDDDFYNKIDREIINSNSEWKKLDDSSYLFSEDGRNQNNSIYCEMKIDPKKKEAILKYGNRANTIFHKYYNWNE